MPTIFASPIDLTISEPTSAQAEMDVDERDEDPNEDGENDPDENPDDNPDDDLNDDPDDETPAAGGISSSTNPESTSTPVTVPKLCFHYNCGTLFASVIVIVINRL